MSACLGKKVGHRKIAAFGSLIESRLSLLYIIWLLGSICCVRISCEEHEAKK